MKLDTATLTACDSLYSATLISLSENGTTPPLKMVDYATAEVDGLLIALNDARDAIDHALDIYYTHQQVIEEIKHRFVVDAMKSLRKHGYIKRELLPLDLDKIAIMECVNMARFLTKI